MKILHWFREDLRLFDNTGLYEAARRGEVVPVFIYPTDLGAASYWWLHHSLSKLSADLESQGVSLILKTGEPEQVLRQIAKELEVQHITWNRVYSPQGIAQGKSVRSTLEEAGFSVSSSNSQLLTEPTKIFNKQGTPFKVFTPFWRHCRTIIDVEPPNDVPAITSFSHAVQSERLVDWGLLPNNPNWASRFPDHWVPGEAGAQARWQQFVEGSMNKYSGGRDIPSDNTTSMLAPHMAFGEISSRQLWFETQQLIANNEVATQDADKFLAQLGWREFSRYLLTHFPAMIDQPFNQKFNNFPWQDDNGLIEAWKHGKTGYPIVDAGMRELWQTGYMHNRVRMITASFLTKHCLSHWRHGMAWFWDTLLDADIANNTASWQWVSGSGADAAPYFRVFNPILQGEKFDGEGEYTRKWLPELARMPKKYLHKPWEASPEILSLAGVVLGKDYPAPIVDHKMARTKALDAYQQMKSYE